MTRRNLFTVASVLGLVALGGAAWAAGPGDVARLGKDLTPTGGEVAGSKDGAIPSWEGFVPPADGWTYGKYRGDYWKYKGEKPILTIDAGNVDKYADRLSPGQVALVKNTKGYQMDVYPSHRDCSVPDFVADNTKAGISKAKISSDGWSLEDAVLPSVPFPFPQQGIEVMWNFLVRYQGVAVEWPAGRSYVSPRPGSTDGINFTWDQIFYSPWAEKGQHSLQDVGGLLTGWYYAYQEPVALAGQALAQRYYFSKDSEPFYYFTGQRRVRRLPAYSYDAPLIGFENQYPADESFLFLGNPDRFDWKLIGKKEIYIPYNGFATANFNMKLGDAATPGFVNPAVRRYELHRVWVVEGKIKEGMRHTAATKRFYFDEDSWIAVVGEDYDTEGKLWRVNEDFPLPAWEAKTCWSGNLLVLNDLISGRYVMDSMVFGGGKDTHVIVDPAEDRRLKDDFFTADNLRATMQR